MSGPCNLWEKKEKNTGLLFRFLSLVLPHTSYRFFLLLEPTASFSPHAWKYKIDSFPEDVGKAAGFPISSCVFIAKLYPRKLCTTSLYIFGTRRKRDCRTCTKIYRIGIKFSTNGFFHLVNIASPFFYSWRHSLGIYYEFIPYRHVQVMHWISSKRKFAVALIIHSLRTQSFLAWNATKLFSFLNIFVKTFSNVWQFWVKFRCEKKVLQSSFSTRAFEPQSNNVVIFLLLLILLLQMTLNLRERSEISVLIYLNPLKLVLKWFGIRFWLIALGSIVQG